MKYSVLFILVLMWVQGTAQENDGLPFRELSDYPEQYSANSVAARMIESLGFRYYWASEGLTASDLDYKPTEESRSTLETLRHIYDLSKIIRNSAEQKVNDRSVKEDLDYKAMRSATLENLKIAVKIIENSDSLGLHNIDFGAQSFPFWNQINGPIADAIWHCGQLVSFRRITGNPVNSKVNHLTGKLRE